MPDGMASKQATQGAVRAISAGDRVFSAVHLPFYAAPP